MNDEINLLTKAVQNLIQSDNNPDSESYQAAGDYFSNYLTAKTNRKINNKTEED